MSITLHLGVIDIPYVEAPDAPPPKKPGKKPREAKSPSQVTTGDVATWLENKYHVMEHFFQEKQADIAKSLENSLAGSIDSIMAGAPTGGSPFASTEQVIDKSFKRFLSDRGLDALGYPGIPTMAAQLGISHRFKLKGKRRVGMELVHGPERPSFIDTGLYQASFKSWFEAKK